MSYTEEDAKRLTQITQDACTVGFTYDAAFRRSTLTLPNGVLVTYGYDNANRLTSMLYQKGGTTLGDLTYSYDDAGRRTSEGGSFARSNLPAALASTTFDAANGLTNWGGTTLPYDLNGSMTGNGTKTYTWDAKNQLASITGAATASFQYDAFGRRVSKTVSGVTTEFVYDGMNPVQEQNSTGTPTANLLTGLAIDEYFSRTDATGARSFLTDALGSSIALTDSAGVIQTSYTYDPYGETTAALQANGNTFQYTGRENDGTGLYFYRARYYDPVLKRFLSEDPIGLSGGLNTYVEGDPIGLVDPLGLEWMYSQSSGNIYRVTPGGNVQYVGTGYSGQGSGFNNSSMQGEFKIGPIPQGGYTIGPQQLNWVNNGRTKLPGSMRLTPNSNTPSLNRTGGYLIHGGNFTTRTSSQGCIVARPNVRDLIGTSGDHDLFVIP